ncbi:MAG: hypothetical protein HPY52_10480 [Firmicutes bacterium]|nr:hypothetical protein [Bacillota bacterium]
MALLVFVGLLIIFLTTSFLLFAEEKQTTIVNNARTSLDMNNLSLELVRLNEKIDSLDNRLKMQESFFQSSVKRVETTTHAIEVFIAIVGLLTAFFGVKALRIWASSEMEKRFEKGIMDYIDRVAKPIIEGELQSLRENKTEMLEQYRKALDEFYDAIRRPRQ